MGRGMFSFRELFICSNKEKREMSIDVSVSIDGERDAQDKNLIS